MQTYDVYFSYTTVPHIQFWNVDLIGVLAVLVEIIKKEEYLEG